MASPKKPFNGKGKKPAKRKADKKGMGVKGALAIIAGGGAVIGGGLFAANRFEEKKRKAEAAKQDAIRRANEKLEQARRKVDGFKFKK